MELSLGECKIDDAVLEAATAHGDWLTYLCLHGSTGYTDKSPQTLARLCPALKVLAVGVESILVPPLVRVWWQIARPELEFRHGFTYPPFWTDHWKPVYG